MRRRLSRGGPGGARRSLDTLTDRPALPGTPRRHESLKLPIPLEFTVIIQVRHAGRRRAGQRVRCERASR